MRNVSERDELLPERQAEKEREREKVRVLQKFYPTSNQRCFMVCQIIS